ncbi:hypothetical protein NIES298_47340, partial [Microcystis aeruginosa NIES-298]
RVPIIFINKYFTQFIPGKQEGYATTTKSLPLGFFMSEMEKQHFFSVND